MVRTFSSNGKLSTSVVAVCSELFRSPFFVDMHGWVQEQSIGSGTIIDPDGTILTCAHVVADFQSTKAIVRRKVANLALSYLYTLFTC
jgi:S1-C subfamily serine protease